jgi:hypothetical protein
MKHPTWKASHITSTWEQAPPVQLAIQLAVQLAEQNDTETVGRIHKSGVQLSAFLHVREA